MSDFDDVVIDVSPVPAVIPKKTNPNKLAHLNKSYIPNQRSAIRMELLKNETFKLVGDDTNTNIFDYKTMYIDDSGHIRDRKTKKVLFKNFQVERTSSGDNPVIRDIQVNHYNNIQSISTSTNRANNTTNPSGLQKSIAALCGNDGELIAKKLVEISGLKKRMGPKPKKETTSFTPQQQIEALKLLVYYFAGKPLETKEIDKSITSTMDKKVMSFMQLVGKK